MPLIWVLLIIPCLMLIHTYPTWRAAISLGLLFSAIKYGIELTIGHWSTEESIYLISGSLMNAAIFYTAAFFRVRYEEVLGELKKLTYIDPLTGLHNRRFFEEHMTESLKQSAQKQSTILLILLDLDHFKKVNDTYGHVCGDLVLKETGEAIRRNIHTTDAVVRLGGEEFALISQDITMKDGIVMFDRIIREVEQLHVIYKEKAVPVTISAGIAIHEGETSEAFIDKADRALYEAKRSGRNRLVVS
ncbi:GGDEF domain-containing protein [Domibacillus tundrae]|uniref:GGDEF domain-containing protein n=1 Tax=Domibacillus tundrae TaxID=1587527 RepID=UPI00069903FA|nr:GGDEF domain-containing protein [Domibacillus tundrae]